MSFFQKLNAEWAIRLSLGAMYIYSGVDILQNPKNWTFAIYDLPMFLQNPIVSFGVGRFLHTLGIVEILLAVIFLLWFMPRPVVKYAGLVSAIEMVLIVLFVGVSLMTFRDIGLIGPGLALFFMRKDF